MRTARWSFLWLLAWPLLAGPAAAADAALARAFQAAGNQKIAGLRSYLGDRYDACSAELGALESQIAAGLLQPGPAMDQAAAAGAGCLVDALAAAIAARRELNAAAGALLSGASTGPAPGLLSGEGGVVDKLYARVNGELEKHRKRVEKRLRAYAKSVARTTDGAFAHTLLVPPLRMELGFVPNNPAFGAVATEEALYGLRILLALGGSSLAAPSDGRLCVTGRAFLGLFSEGVNVYVFGPSMSPVSQTNVAPEASGLWQATLTGLPAANFQVVADQDPDHDTTAVEVPPELIAIGVP